MAWGTVAGLIAVVYPLLESKEILRNVFTCTTYKPNPGENESPSVSRAASRKDFNKDTGVKADDITVDAK